VKGMRSLFRSLTVCVPWHMEGPFPGDETGDTAFVHILRPPEDLKPQADFARLFSEYHLWMRQHQDKGYAGFLKMAGEMARSQDTLWDIRGRIRRMGESSSGPKEHLPLKWHLILHMARRIEEARGEAEAALEKVKRQRPPLQEALEKGALIRDLFDDLPSYRTEPIMEPGHLRQVFEAWFDLFGKRVQDTGPFVTLDPHIMTYVTDLFEERVSEPSRETDVTRDFQITRCHLPSLSNGRKGLEDPVLAGLSGRTLMLLEPSPHG
jgi:hypothetical protein